MNLSADYFFPNDLTADVNVMNVGANQLYIEPRFAYGEFDVLSKETGWLWGIKGEYDFLYPGLGFFGLESGYMQGDVKDDAVKTDYQDFFVEAKVGYPFAQLGTLQFTPFLGLAYEKESFHYLSLELNQPKDHIHYGYVSFGFLSRLWYQPGFSIGLNLKAKYLFLGNYKNKSDQPHTCSLANKFHYEIELPVMLQLSNQMEIGIVPFYQHKVYCLQVKDLEWIDKIKIKALGIGFRLNYLF